MQVWEEAPRAQEEQAGSWPGCGPRRPQAGCRTPPHAHRQSRGPGEALPPFLLPVPHLKPRKILQAPPGWEHRLGSIRLDQVLRMSSVPLRGCVPVLATLSLAASGLPTVTLRPIFPKHCFHLVTPSAHKPEPVFLGLTHQLQPEGQALKSLCNLGLDHSPITRYTIMRGFFS